MLHSMVAMPTLDLIVSVLWIAVLAVVLLAQAVYAWLGHRHWAHYARQAARLAEATRPPSSAVSAAGATPELKVLPGGLATPVVSARPDDGADIPAEA
jgi:hypothetical protein